MSETQTQTCDGMTATETPAAREPKARRFHSVGLRGDGGQLMRITAEAKKDGSAVTYVTVTTPGKKGAAKGASERHADLDKARARMERLAADAAKLGWTRKASSGGFKARPDAFDAAHLPSPAGAAPKATKKK